MNPSRISNEAFVAANQLPGPGAAAFCVMPMASAAPAPMSPLQWIYQQLYQHAVQANVQRRTLPDLFVVMN